MQTLAESTMDEVGASPRIEDYFSLVSHISKQVMRRLPSYRDCCLDYQDLFQVGVCGLLRAERRFDPDRGVQFSTYAEHSVRGEIWTEIRDRDWAARSQRKKIQRGEAEEITRISLDAVPLDFRESLPVPTEAPGPEEILIEKEVHKALVKLSSREQTVLYLIFWEEKLFQEVGDVLGVSESRVSQIYGRLLLKLGKRFRNMGYGSQ